MTRSTWNRILHGALQVGFLRGLAVQFANAAAFSQPILAVDHDDLAGFQPVVDQGLAIADLRDVNGTQGRGVVGRYDIDIAAVRPLLYGGAGDSERVLLNLEQQARVHQLARPQPMLMGGADWA